MADPFEQFRADLETALADIEILKRGDLPAGTDVEALPVREGCGGMSITRVGVAPCKHRG